ncbi:MAG TPA: AroM family protein [Candidatus Limnocylindrales bacterium]|nr:AroM family protein [Candidatus Limnocylindrales bacterium]
MTIGHAPRPDLLEPLLARVGGEHVSEFGALDDLPADRIPRSAAASERAYPLTTRLRDGAAVTIDEADLAPLVQHAIDRAEDAGAVVTLLLCAGGFLDTTARGTLVRPFDAAVAHLGRLGARRLAVVVPYATQVEPSRRKWSAAGFDAAVIVADPGTLDPTAAAGSDAIVLDYVGHPRDAINAVRATTAIPVVDLGESGADAAVAALAALPGRSV